MNRYVAICLGLILSSCTSMKTSNNHKKDVAIWYEAFNARDPKPIDRILSEDWMDVPAAPGQPPGREGAKHILNELTTTFPDFKITIKDIIQEGARVAVRSEITGTQKGPFMGFPAKNRVINIQAIDIHEFRDGRIVQTWHTEDWMTGLHQIGALGK